MFQSRQDLHDGRNGKTRSCVGFVACSVIVGVSLLWPRGGASAGERDEQRVYENRLRAIDDPEPILADFPEFVQPIVETTRYEAPPLIDEKGADLAVRAWRFSYNARGIIEVPNRLRADRTAIVIVHPWGLDDGQGWITPEPAGVAFFCTLEKNQLSRRHSRKVIDPFLKSLRDRVSLVMYSLPGKEDPIRRKIYRSVRNHTTVEARTEGQAELEQKLKSFAYEGQPLPEQLTLSPATPVIDYFQQFPGLDAGAKYNNAGYWELPIPVVSDIDVALDDVVMYDGDGYDVLSDYLKKEGIRHVLVGGYATDMCVCSTTAGYENLRKDFNTFLVGDATLATFPGNHTPAYATNAAISFASLNLFITQTSWVRPLEDKRVAQDK